MRTIRVTTQRGSALTHFPGPRTLPTYSLLLLLGIIIVIASVEHLLYTIAHLYLILTIFYPDLIHEKIEALWDWGIYTTWGL